MNTVLNIALAVLFLFVGAWVLIFGGIGATLSHAREGGWISGFVLGVVLGPIGWGVVMWRTRATRRRLDGSTALGGETNERWPSSSSEAMGTATEGNRPLAGGGHDY